MKLRLWPPLWMVYEPLRSVGVLPQPAVEAADADGPAIVMAATAPAVTRVTAPRTASQRERTSRGCGAFTALTPCLGEWGAAPGRRGTPESESSCVGRGPRRVRSSAARVAI